MSIDLKLVEARNNLNMAIACKDNPMLFNQHFSAFTTSARSVIQYILTKCKPPSVRMKWYNEQVAQFDTFKTFKDIRDQNIHDEIFFPGCKISASASISMSVGVRNVQIKNSDGNVVESYASPQEARLEDLKSPTSTATYLIRFNGDHVDLLPLCQRYLDQLVAFRQLAKN